VFCVRVAQLLSVRRHMRGKRIVSILGSAVAGAIAGLLFGILLTVVLQHSAPTLLDVLGMPATLAFELWHAMGLPPQTEAAFAGPFFAFFIQWILLGLIIGALSGVRRAATPPPPHKCL
jgi:hypothetical protein